MLMFLSANEKSWSEGLSLVAASQIANARTQFIRGELPIWEFEETVERCLQYPTAAKQLPDNPMTGNTAEDIRQMMASMGFDVTVRQCNYSAMASYTIRWRDLYIRVYIGTQDDLRERVALLAEAFDRHILSTKEQHE